MKSNIPIIHCFSLFRNALFYEIMPIGYTSIWHIAKFLQLTDITN